MRSAIGKSSSFTRLYFRCLADRENGEELVPIGKAYSGITTKSWRSSIATPTTT
jgi:hypothetical protein